MKLVLQTFYYGRRKNHRINACVNAVVLSLTPISGVGNGY